MKVIYKGMFLIELIRLRGLLNSLPSTEVNGKTKVSSIAELFEKINSLNIDGKVAPLERQKENILTEIKETENNIKLLEEYSFFPGELSYTASFIWTFLFWSNCYRKIFRI